MVVYFIGGNTQTLTPVKIGVSANPDKRMKALQTGNPMRLVFMGWIVTDDDYAFERKLHKHFSIYNEHLEWFNIDHNDILPILLDAGKNGFVAQNEDAFQIIGYDRDAIPEYLGICDWADFTVEQCCPFCGCLSGMHFQEASSMYYCPHCNELTDFPTP